MYIFLFLSIKYMYPYIRTYLYDMGLYLQDVAAEYGVHAMPTFLLFKKGNQVDKVVGASKDDLQKKIEKHGTTST